MNKFKKLLAVFLCLDILFPVSPLYLFADDNISNIDPSGSVYTIEPTSTSGTTGFREYENFTLPESYTANLVFNGNYNKFINLVDNQVNINGLLQTVNNSGAFYNGSAIFVSPNGIVVGPSGVINTGSLALISTTSSSYSAYKTSKTEDNYENLITDASGNVVINGKIMTKGTAKVYGQNITVENAGLTTEGTGQSYSDSATAASVFDTIVNSSVQSANSFTVQNGKVILSAKDGSVSVTDSKVKAKDVNVSAQDTISYTIHQDETVLDYDRNKFFKSSSADVSFSNSTVNAGTLTVSANGTYTGDAHTSMLPSVVWDSLLSLATDTERQAYIDKIFSSSVFEGFDGARSSATINVNNSTFNTTGDLILLTSASSRQLISEAASPSIPDFIYTIGTGTTSKINIKDSTLSASGNANILSLSDSALTATFSRSDGLFKASEQEAFNFALINAATVTDTGVTIDNSSITGATADIDSISQENTLVKTLYSATVGKDAFGSLGEGTGASIAVVINNSDIKNNIDIKNSSTITATEGDLTARAVDVSSINASITTKTTEEKIINKENIALYSAEGFIFDKLVGTDTAKKQSLLNGFRMIHNKGVERFNGEAADFTGSFKTGGSFLFTNSKATVNNTVTSSILNAAGNLNLLSYRYDKYLNYSMTNAKDGDTTVAAGVAFLLNNRSNDTKVELKDSTAESAGKTEIKAITENPANNGSFKVQLGIFQLLLTFNEGARNLRDVSGSIQFGLPASLDSIISVGLTDFYNNVAASSTKSTTLSIGASIIKDSVKNTTDVVVDNSDLSSGSDLTTVSVNSFASLDVAGFDFLLMQNKKNIKDIWNTDSTGTSLIIQDFENNAKTNVKNSSEVIASGDINLGSASEQLLLSLAKLGVQSSTVGVSGSVLVQNIKGTTGSYVNTNSLLKGSSVTVNSGKVNTGLFKAINDNAPVLKEERELKDQVTFVDITGSLMAANTTETVLDVGAAVNVKNVERTVETEIENATVQSTGSDTDISSSTEQTGVEVSLAGAYFKSQDDDKSGAAAANNAANLNNAANNAANNAVNNNIVNNVPGGGNAADAANNAANPANRVSFNLTTTGSVTVFHDKTNVSTILRNSNISSAGALNALSKQDNYTFMLSGALAETVTLGAGAAVNLYKRSGSVTSLIDTSTVTASRTAVDAQDNTELTNMTAGVGIVDETENSSYSAVVGGSFSFNTVSPTVSSQIKDSTVEGASDNAGVSVTAKGTAKDLSIAGAVTKDGGSSLAISSSIAAVADHIKSVVNAKITGSTLTEKIGNVTVKANEEAEIKGLSASLSATESSTGTGASFDGSLGIVYVQNDIDADLSNTETDAKGKIDVVADQSADALSLAGTGGLSLASQGLGINGAVVIDVQESTVDAKIAPGTDKEIQATGDISVKSSSTEEITNAPVSAAIAKDSSMLAATVSIALVNNSVNSQAAGNISTGGSFNFYANDDTFLLTRGGTLAFTGEGTIAVDAAVNVDRLHKTVNATVDGAEITAAGDVNVKATSADAMGATEEDIINEDGDYGKDTSLNLETIHNNVTKWNLFFNVAAGINANIALPETTIVKYTDNSVLATLSNSTVNSRNLTVNAKETSLKNVFAGSISATMSAVAGGVQVLTVTDDSDVKATVSSSMLDVTNSTNIKAEEDKEEKLVLIAGAASEHASVTANVLVDNQKDDAEAKLSSSTVNKGALTVETTESFDATKVLAGGEGSRNVAVNVSPIDNNYTKTSKASIDGSTVNSTASGVTVSSASSTDAYNFALGLGFVLQGASATGVGVGNDYTNTSFAFINNSNLANNGNTSVLADNTTVLKNTVIAASAASQGAGLTGNVVVNDMATDTQAYINNSTVTSTGAVKVAVNESDNSDTIENLSISLGGALQGANIDANLIFNYLKNKTTAKILNTNIAESASLSVLSLQNRGLTNKSYLGSISGEGVTANVNLIKDRLDTSVISLLDSDTKTVSVNGEASVSSSDKTEVSIESGNFAVGTAGAGVGVNVILHEGNGTAKTQINGTVSAGSLNAKSHLQFGFKQEGVGVLTGIAGLYADVTKIRLGNSVANTDMENTAKLSAAETKVNDAIEAVYDEELPAETTDEKGSVTDINASVTVADQMTVSASTVLKGTGEDETLELNNTSVSVSGAVGAAVKSLKANTNTAARVSGGTVTAKNLNISSAYTDNVQVKSLDVGIESLNISGGATTYSNTSTTTAGITGGTVTVSETLNIDSSVNTKSETSLKDVRAVGAEIGGAGYENISSGTARTIISGTSTAVTAKTLNIKTSGSMDLYGYNNVIKYSAAEIKFMKNVAKGNLSLSALIQDGASVYAQNLNIGTEYSKMKVATKNNLVKITSLEIAGTEAKSEFATTFKSGISGAGSVTVTGNTTINTAKKANDDTENILSLAEVDGVDISIVNFYGGADAIALNNGVSETVLNSTGFTTKNLTINAYLDSNSVAKGSDTAASLGAVKNIDVIGKSNSELKITLAGTGSVTGETAVNTNHNASTDVGLSAFSAGIIGNISALDVLSEMTSQTTVNIGGSFNFNNFTGNFNTNRYGKLDLSKKGGGLVSVDNSDAQSTITGGSAVTISGLNTSSATTGSFSLANNVTTTGDYISHSSDGGFISVSLNDAKYNFNTLAKTDITDSNINVSGTFSAVNNNSSTVKDSSTNSGGGFVEVHSETTKNTYTAETQLNVTGSTINAKDLELKGKTNIATDSEDYLKHTSSVDGVITSTGIKVYNYLNQNNTVSIANSTLAASENADISASSAFGFRQQAEAKTGGFITTPKATAKLYSNNNNTISTDAASSVTAGDSLSFVFDVSGALYTYANAEANDVGSEPKSDSYLELNIDNNMTNSGTLSAGNYLLINYLKDSSLDLHQESYSKHEATAPFTEEDGSTKKTVNNTLSVPLNAKLKTGKYMDILMEKGTENIFSDVHYKIIYEAIFIDVDTDEGHDTDNITNNLNNSFTLNGEIIAGDATESRKLVIKRDGTVDEENSFGFSSDDYTVYNGDASITGKSFKTLKLSVVDERITALDGKIAELESRIRECQNAQTDLNNLLTRYSEVNTQYSKVEMSELNTEFNADFKSAVLTSMGGSGSSDVYDSILTGFSDVAATKTFNQYLRESYPEWVSSFATAASTVRIEVISLYANEGCYIGMFAYDGKIAMSQAMMESFESSVQALVSEATSGLAEATNAKVSAQAEKQKYVDARAELENKTAEEFGLLYQPYAYVFKDIDLHKGARVNITGISADKMDELATTDPLQFKIQKSAGLEIENYSKYSLVFGDIDIGTKLTGSSGTEAVKEILHSDVESQGPALEINGEDKEDLIITTGSEVRGVTINSYSDMSNPLNINDTGYDESQLGNIVVNGYLRNNNEDSGSQSNISIYTQSGDILINAFYGDVNRTDTITASQGSIYIAGETVQGTNTSYKSFKFGQSSGITAGNDLVIIADTVDIEGTLKAGILNRTLNLAFTTMPLVTDPSTGEENSLIQTGSDSNINAIYRDGTVYVFDIGDTNGKVLLRAGKTNDVTGSITGTVAVEHGFNTVSINSTMSAVDNLVIGEINNVSDTYSDVEVISTGSVDMSSATTTLNGRTLGNITGSPVVMNRDNDTEANVDISGIDSITFIGKINNGIFTDIDGNLLPGGSSYIRDDSSILTIRGPQSITVGNGIVAGGVASFYTEDIADLIIRDSGYIDAPGFLYENNDSVTDNPIDIKNIATQNAILVTTTDSLKATNISVGNHAEFETASAKVVVENSDISRNADAPIKLYTGNISNPFTLLMEGNKVVTDSFVVYSNRDVLVKSAMGYHTFESLAISEAGSATSFAFNANNSFSVSVSLVQQNTETIENNQ